MQVVLTVFCSSFFYFSCVFPGVVHGFIVGWVPEVHKLQGPPRLRGTSPARRRVFTEGDNGNDNSNETQN